jgi:hypothetical protein
MQDIYLTVFVRNAATRLKEFCSSLGREIREKKCEQHDIGKLQVKYGPISETFS